MNSKFWIACQGLEGQTLQSQRVTQDMALVGGLCLIQALYPGCALIYWCTHAWTSALERRILKSSHFKAKCSLGHQGLYMLKNSKTNGYLYYLKARGRNSRRPPRPWPSMPDHLAVMPLTTATKSRPSWPCPDQGVGRRCPLQLNLQI